MTFILEKIPYWIAILFAFTHDGSKVPEYVWRSEMYITIVIIIGAFVFGTDLLKAIERKTSNYHTRKNTIIFTGVRNTFQNMIFYLFMFFLLSIVSYISNGEQTSDRYFFAIKTFALFSALKNFFIMFMIKQELKEKLKM